MIDFNKVMPLAAIWMNTSVALGDGRVTRRITSGDMIRIQDDELVNCLPGQVATHEIRECRGKLSSDFSIECLNRLTEKIETFNL